jgi:hypothetical protein
MAFPGASSRTGGADDVIEFYPVERDKRFASLIEE